MLKVKNTGQKKTTVERGFFYPTWFTESSPIPRPSGPLYKRGGIVLLFLILVLAPSARGRTSLDKAELMDLFREGTAWFHQANELAATQPEKAQELYHKAVLRFERIVEKGGIENGKLYYNIGNTYFRMKDIGRAILNYRRAQQYMPHDPNLQQNLEYARVRRLDKVEEKQKTRVLKTVFFWHYDLSARVRFVLFMLMYIVFWLCAIVRLLVRKSFLGWSIALSGVVSGLFLSSLLVEAAAFRRLQPGVFIAAEAVARKGDSETYEPSFKEPLHAGTEFTLIESRGDWCHIELPDARRCWVRAKNVEFVRSRWPRKSDRRAGEKG